MNKLNKLLSYLDIFTYVPKPQAYEISTTQSKTITFVLIIIYLSYFCYQIYYYIVVQNPVLSNYILDTPSLVCIFNNQKVQFPNISYGYYYGQNTYSVLNDPSYFTISFQSVLVDNSQITTVQTVTTVKQITNCNSQWIKSLPSIFTNLTCLQSNQLLQVKYQLIYVQNPPTQSQFYVIQRLIINLCNSSNSNISCKNQQQMQNMFQSGVFVVFVQEPKSNNYKDETALQNQLQYRGYNFYLTSYFSKIITIPLQPWVFIYIPNYLTIFNDEIVNFTKSQDQNNQAILNSGQANIMQIEFQLSSYYLKTLIQKESFISFIANLSATWITIVGITAFCILRIQKKKFLRKNPGWAKFDEYHKQNLIRRLSLDRGQIQQIRKQVQLKQN